MESKGNDALITTTKVTEINFNHAGYIPVVTAGFFLLGVVSAYAIAVLRGNVDPVLPLISDAAGSPPQNGVFGTLVVIGGMFGVVFMIQRYMIVMEKNREQKKIVTAVNRLSLFVGIVSMLGLTLITGYPVNFYRNRDVWFKDVGLPHMIGAIAFSSMGVIYISLQCILTLFVKQGSSDKSHFFLRVILLFLCTAAFVNHLITVPEHMGGISHLYYINSTYIESNDTSLLPYPPTLGADLKLPIDTGGTYFTAAVTQWAFVFFFCLFFLTFYGETQQFSLQFIIETHTIQQATDHPDGPDFRKASLVARNGSVVEAKPNTEVRKFLRRDSTCQTIDDKAPVKILAPSKKASTKTQASNGTSNFALSPEVDEKLSRLLSEVDKPPEIKITENGVDKTPVEKVDDEAERNAIEKIDAVVDNAEKEDVGIGTDPPATKESASKSDDDEEKPSSCPLAVQ